MGCNEMKDKKKPNPNPVQNSVKEDLKNEENKGNIMTDLKPEIYPIIDTNKEEFKISNNNTNNNDQENIELLGTQNDEQKLRSINNLKNSNNNNNNNNLLIIDNEEYNPDYIGKLCFEPLLLFIYECKKKSFQVKKYEQSLYNFDKLNNTSSYCNGDNKLFISGGIDNNGEKSDNLRIFDLGDFSVEEPLQISPKYNHSMIYIPKNYIFFIGGNDLITFYLDIKEKKIINWDKLNKVRIEPALIQVNNYLYVFDNINKDEDNINFELTFEKTNLLTNNPKWELIKPKISSDIFQTNIIPKFFGVSRESDNNIIFLGGNILDEQDNLDEIKNYKYNISENEIEISDVPFISFQLNEKSFLSYNNKNNIYLILPNFYKKNPQVVFYIKNKNIVKVIDYMPNAKYEERRMFLKNKKCDFNMPKNNENMNEIKDF